MTLSEEILKRIDVLNAEMSVIKQFIMSRDVVTRLGYCELKGISKSTLHAWIKKGCPVEDNRHVSISAVDRWVKEREFKKSKQTEA